MRLEVEEHFGTVILRFGDGDHAILKPEEAVNIGTTLVRYAHHIQTGLDVPDKKLIAEKIRSKLLTRCSLVIKNLTDRNEKPLYIANEIVDIILSEAL